MKGELLNDGTYKIEIDTQDNNYIVSELIEGIWDELKSFRSYSFATEYIQNRIKRKSKESNKKIEPLDAIYSTNGFEKNKVKITSVSESSWDGKIEVWFSDSEKKRNKRKITYLFKDNEKNNSIFSEIERLRLKISELDKQKENFTEEEIKKYFLTE